MLSSFGDALAEAIELPRAVIDALGVIPSYYLRYFYAERTVLEEQRVLTPRAEVVADIERRLLELYRDPTLAEKPALLEQRGGAFYSEAAIQLVASLTADTGDVQVVDVRNHGTLAGLRTTMSSRSRLVSGPPERCPCRSRRLRPSCSAWSSTSRPTSGSPRPRRRAETTIAPAWR